MQNFTALLIALGLLLSLGPAAPAQSNQVGNAAPCISWQNPLVPPRFALLCIHGLGLYSKSYEQFGTRISRMGAAVYAIDVRGFGSWMKAQGHQEIDFDACLQDIKTALVSIHTAHPDLPVFLLGESMGGAIALRAASMYPDSINGLISCVPAGERFQNKRTDLQVALHMLQGPNKQFDIGKSVIEQASTGDRVEGDKKVKVVDTQEIDEWESDPLDRMSLSPKELIQFQKFMNDNHDAAKNVVNLPVLFFQGIDDHLVRPDGTWELFKELTTHNRTMVALPSRHLIFEQAQDSKRVLNMASTRLVLAWILTQLGDNSPIPTLSTTSSINPGGNTSNTTINTANNTVSGSAANTTNGTSSNTSLDLAIAKISQADYAAAQTQLQQILQLQPDNSEAHYWLGVSLLKQEKPLLARQEFMQSMASGRGLGHSNDANNLLLSLDAPNEKTRPLQQLARMRDRTGRGINAGSGQAPTAAGKQLTQGKPSVIVFSADWCQQCRNVDSMIAKGRQMFGARVQFTKVDVANQTNNDIVKAFSVGPIPTIVFLDGNGAVSSTLIGETTMVNIAKKISGIIR